MESVFLYFLSIGAGLSLGLTIGAIPIIYYFTKRAKKVR